jgi:hypothetical protein
VNRSTALGRLFRENPQAGKLELLRVMRRHRGRIMPTAYELGINWRFLIRIVWREALWHEVDKIRSENQPHVIYEDEEWLARTRAALGTRGTK